MLFDCRSKSLRRLSTRESNVEQTQQNSFVQPLDTKLEHSKEAKSQEPQVGRPISPDISTVDEPADHITVNDAADIEPAVLNPSLDTPSIIQGKAKKRKNRQKTTRSGSLEHTDSYLIREREEEGTQITEEASHVIKTDMVGVEEERKNVEEAHHVVKKDMIDVDDCTDGIPCAQPLDISPPDSLTTSSESPHKVPVSPKQSVTKATRRHSSPTIWEKMADGGFKSVEGDSKSAAEDSKSLEDNTESSGSHVSSTDETIVETHPLVKESVRDGKKPDTSAADATSKQLIWAYATHTDADKILLDNGIYLWEKPPTYFQPRPVAMKASDLTTPAPVTVSHGTTGTPNPVLLHDGKSVHIIPPESPWDDVRSSECHPDFQPPTKLAEYQACEAAGYPVWRHDRDVLPCRRAGCEVMLVDSDKSTRICLGCGSKTLVRYCRFEHQVDDLHDHWKFCGHPDLIMQVVIDNTTEPIDFSQYPPAIFDVNGQYSIQSVKTERQKLHFMLNGGYYSTFFDPSTDIPTTLSWPQGNPKSSSFNRRIERVLNVVFLDMQNTRVMFYLFRLLRQLMIYSGSWNLRTKNAFETQFLDEFHPGWRQSRRESRDPTRLDHKPLCECEWYGDEIAQYQHQASCKMRNQRRKGQQAPTRSLKTVVEEYENRYWILRAWQQQHPTVKDWKIRANGYGLLPLQTGEDIFTLGPGWTGWGEKESNAGCMGPKLPN